MSRKELNKRQKALNLLFTVKVPIGNRFYIVYKPLYKEYMPRVRTVIGDGVRRVFKIRIDPIITAITVIAAITTIVMGVKSCLTI